MIKHRLVRKIDIPLTYSDNIQWKILLFAGQTLSMLSTVGTSLCSFTQYLLTTSAYEQFNVHVINHKRQAGAVHKIRREIGNTLEWPSAYKRFCSLFVAMSHAFVQA